MSFGIQPNVRIDMAELHSRGQSLLPQEFPEDKIFTIRKKRFISYFIRPTIFQHLNTNNYDCDVNNGVKVKKCFDDFYMSKLNCTFPWLDNTTNTCGSEKKVYDLMRLMKDSNIKNSTLNEEVKEFGCKLRNCQDTIWTAFKTKDSGKFKYTRVDFRIPASMV